jgi:hypothetical protein
MLPHNWKIIFLFERHQDSTLAFPLKWRIKKEKTVNRLWNDSERGIYIVYEDSDRHSQNTEDTLIRETKLWILYIGSLAFWYDIPWNTHVERMGKPHSLHTLVVNN